MIVMMGHVITLNIGKTMLPDGVHGDATRRGGGHYLGMIVVCVGIYGGMASCYGDITVNIGTLEDCVLAMNPCMCVCT